MRDKGLEEARVVELDPANLEHALEVMPGVLHPTAAGLECASLKRLHTKIHTFTIEPC